MAVLTNQEELQELRVLAIVIIGWLAFCGCGRPAVSPLLRLERDAPVDERAFVFKELRVEDSDVLKTIPSLSLKSNQKVSLTGKMQSGKSRINGIVATWKPREGESQEVSGISMRPDDRPGVLLLLIHSEDLSREFGVVCSETVEARLTTANNQPEVEFRVDFAAPNRLGKYVADLQFGEITPPQRNEPLSKPVGYPILRFELTVE